MPKIIDFRSKDQLRKEALDKLGIKISAHLAGVFFERNILDLPVQGLVRQMCDILIKDGFDYDPEVLQKIEEYPDAMNLLTRSFVTTLIANGYLPESFSL